MSRAQSPTPSLRELRDNLPRGYSRIVIHSGPDEKGHYHHTRYWITDYTPGHPDGECVTREVGQVYLAPLPTEESDV